MSIMHKHVVICCFSCKPGAGSEWGVGWNYFRFCLRKFSHVTLISRNAEDQMIEIQNQLTASEKSKASLIFLEDLPLGKLLKKKHFFNFFIILQYFYWQLNAVRYIRLNALAPEYLLHVTWVSDWMPSFIHLLCKSSYKVYGPIGSQNKNFFSIISSFNFRYYVKAVLRFSPINIINAISSDCIIAISDRYRGKFPWCFNDKVFSITPVNSEVGFTRGSLTQCELISFNFIGKNLSFKNFCIFQKAAHKLLELKLVDRVGVYGDFQNFDPNIEPGFEFYGVLPLNEMYKKLSNQTSIIFQPSCEAGGTVGIEAMSLGIPVINFSGYGLSEFYQDNPFQIEYGDGWENDLASLVVNIIKNYQSHSAEISNDFLQNFSFDNNYNLFSMVIDSAKKRFD